MQVVRFIENKTATNIAISV